MDAVDGDVFHLNCVVVIGYVDVVVIGYVGSSSASDNYAQRTQRTFVSKVISLLDTADTVPRSF